MKAVTAFEIAVQACRYAETVRERKRAQIELDRAYFEWKCEYRVGYIERRSPAWNAMLEATSEEYSALVKAKRRERYHSDRLVRMAGEAR